MARRRKDDDEGISLFPFMSVLACVIGILTLMITATTLAQMDTDGVANAEEFEQVTAELEVADAELEQLEERTAAAGEKHQELQKAQWELGALTAKLDKLRATMPQETEAVDLAPRLADLKTLEQEYAQLQEQVANLEKQVAELPAPPEGAVVEIKPGGTGIDIEPTFVECRADSIVLHDSDPPKRIPRSEIATNTTYLALLDAVAAREKRSVIFLVRSDGIDAYYQASQVARGRYARNGKLPVIGQGKIDLSVFRR